MIARTESRVARWISPSLAGAAGPASAALARILSPSAFSVAGQSPSRALIRSPLGVCGQFGFFHDAPVAVLDTLAGSSPRLPKKSRQPGSTDIGSFSYF